MGKQAVTWSVALYAIRTTGTMFQAGRMFLMAGFATYIVCTKILFIFKNLVCFCKESQWTHKCSMETIETKRLFLFLRNTELSHLSNQKFSYWFLPLWNPQAVAEKVEIKDATEMQIPANMFFFCCFRN